MNYLTHQLLNPQEIKLLKKNLNLQDLSWQDGKKQFTTKSRIRNI